MGLNQDIRNSIWSSWSLKLSRVPIVAAIIMTLLIAMTPLNKIIIAEFVTLHTFLEFMCISIAIMIFAVHFTLRSHSRVEMYKYFGIPFLGIAILDLLHTLSYKGLPDLISVNTPQKSISFWLAARELESLAFVCFALSSRYGKLNKLSASIIFLILVGFVGLISGVTFFSPESLPAFVDADGRINSLKVFFEYVFIFMHCLVAYLLAKMDQDNSAGYSDLISASMILAIGGLSFSSFADGHDLVIFTGHVLKVVAYFYIFKCGLFHELRRPYHNLIQLNQELHNQTLNIKDLQSQLMQRERLGAFGEGVVKIVHDLNNMLGVIGIANKKILSLIAKEEASSSIKKYADTIDKSLSKTMGHQQMLLAKAKGLPEQVSESIDLKIELESLHSLFDTLVGSKILLSIECAESVKITLNKWEFEQVLMNLVVNARDAIKVGTEGRIEIHAIRVENLIEMDTISGQLPVGKYIKISVTDSGCGIEDREMQNIFNLFFTTKEPGKGTGIGLSTVLDYVKKWGGWILVRSQVGKGSEFSIFLREDPIVNN